MLGLGDSSSKCDFLWITLIARYHLISQKSERKVHKQVTILSIHKPFPHVSNHYITRLNTAKRSSIAPSTKSLPRRSRVLVAGLQETANAEEDRSRRRGGKERQAASPFPSKSGLRPKVLLSSRRRSPGCEGYTESRFASTYRVGPVATFHLTVPTLTLQHEQERQTRVLGSQTRTYAPTHAKNRHRCSVFVLTL